MKPMRSSALRPISPAREKRMLREAFFQLEDALAGRPTTAYRRFPRPEAASKDEVKLARKATHATQRSFAQLVGVSLETIKAWEAGIRKPEGPATKLIRLLKQKPEFAAQLGKI